MFSRRNRLYEPAHGHDHHQQSIWGPNGPYGHHGNSHTYGHEPSVHFSGMMRIDHRETPEAYLFRAELPGLTPNDVQVELEEGRFLHLSGVRAVEREEKGDRWRRVERSQGKFSQRFKLPENAKADRIQASFEGGGLTVTVPKHHVYGNGNMKQHHVKKIDVN